MGRYTDLIHKQGDKAKANILNVNINGIPENRDTSIEKPTVDRPKDTLKGSSERKPLQGVSEASEGDTTLRPTTLTTLIRKPPESTTLIPPASSPEDYEQKRLLFLRAVEYLRARGGKAATDALTDTEPEELDRVWLDEDFEIFRSYLRRRCKEALAAVEEGRPA